MFATHVLRDNLYHTKEQLYRYYALYSRLRFIVSQNVCGARLSLKKILRGKGGQVPPPTSLVSDMPL